MRPGLSLKLNQTLTHRKSTLTLSVAALLILAMLAYGPILQPDGYHAFADQRHWLDIANSADVLSNIGFFWWAPGLCCDCC